VPAEEVAVSNIEAAVTGRLRVLLMPALRDAGIDLEDVAVTPAGRRRLVRVIVDRDGGLTLDDVADVSRSVSAILDSADALGETSYVLEVSSPGVDRPLREPRHWRRAVGRLVAVTVAGKGPVTARITAADEDGVMLSLAADGTEHCRAPYAALGPGAVQVEFGQPPAEDLEATADSPAARQMNPAARQMNPAARR
jgi:ribosome maturation factor RimP